MTQQEEALFQQRLARHRDELRWLYMELYDNGPMFDALCGQMHGYAETRAAALKARDAAREADPDWYKRNDLLGMMLYVHNFGGTLRGVEGHLDYIQECGVNYLHLMPLLASPRGKSDGGYAVADFRTIQPELGTMEDFNALTSACHQKGISVCLDFVMNHTSEEHEWARRARAGEKEYQDRYFFFDDDTIPNQYEQTCPQVFPTTAPGNFTWLPECGHYVMTTFYPYQWDLNYRNPRVFNEMMYNFLFFANLGIGVELPNMDAMILLFTIALVVVGIGSKLIGCGLGAKLCGFKNRQCVQVGCGMACRGEVALIVANKGMAMNIVNPIFFGPIIILVVCCAVFTPIMLKVAFKGENAYEGMEESTLAETFQLSEQVDEVTARLIEGEKRRQGK